MTTATRRPPTRHRPAATRKRHRTGKTAVASWAGRWAIRGARAAAAWTGHHAAGYALLAQEQAARYARHGNVPVVTDLTTGKTYGRHEPGLYTLLDADHDDPRGRWAAMQPLHLTRWDRWWMRIQHEDPQVHTDIRNAVAAKIADRHPRLSGDLPDLDAAIAAWRTVPGEGAMANPVRDFNDLADPDIDPLEFPEELPAHLTDVARLVHNESSDMEDNASDLRIKAAAMRSYADYMESAEADADMVGSLREAAEAMEAAAQQWQQAADAVSASADLTDAAQRRAEAEYGDFKMPRFDKAG